MLAFTYWQKPMEYKKQAEWLDMLPYELTNENIKFLNLLDNPLPTKTNEVRKI